jgi:hypothetical protein
LGKHPYPNNIFHQAKETPGEPVTGGSGGFSKSFRGKLGLQRPRKPGGAKKVITDIGKSLKTTSVRLLVQWTPMKRNIKIEVIRSHMDSH